MQENTAIPGENVVLGPVETLTGNPWSQLVSNGNKLVPTEIQQGPIGVKLEPAKGPTGWKIPSGYGLPQHSEPACARDVITSH